jgi:hypothetical protein
VSRWELDRPAPLWAGFRYPQVLQIRQQLFDIIEEMNSYLVQQYLKDAGIDIENFNIDEFTDFARFYVKELVQVGALLKDVPFSDLTPMGKYNVLKSAYRLWTKATPNP